MNGAEFQSVLAEALKRRYASIPNPEELSFDYEFSPQFERKMKRMIRRFDHIQGKEQRVERKETNFRFRKVAVFALVLVLLMALAACAIHYIIIWNEENNEKQGTLDVTFELENPNTEFRNIEIVVDISIRSGCSLFAVRCCRGILPACHTVNVIVEYHNGKVDISSACVNQMVPADCGSISVACDDDYRKFRVCKLNACCESDCSAVRGMQRVVVHISCSS